MTPFPFKLGWKEQKLNQKTERIIPAAESRLFYHQGDIFGVSQEVGYILAPPLLHPAPPGHEHQTRVYFCGMPAAPPGITHFSLNKKDNNKTLITIKTMHLGRLGQALDNSIANLGNHENAI